MQADVIDVSDLRGAHKQYGLRALLASGEPAQHVVYRNGQIPQEARVHVDLT